MSMITEQVHYLRSLAADCQYGDDEVRTAIDAAADTIEMLSEKLQAANMKRSAEDCVEWITDRFPTKEECTNNKKEFAVTVDANGMKTLVMDFEYETVRGKEVARWKWRDRLSPWEVIAWRPLPEPYHEP